MKTGSVAALELGGGRQPASVESEKELRRLMKKTGGPWSEISSKWRYNKFFWTPYCAYMVYLCERCHTRHYCPPMCTISIGERCIGVCAGKSPNQTHSAPHSVNSGNSGDCGNNGNGSEHGWDSWERPVVGRSAGARQVALVLSLFEARHPVQGVAGTSPVSR